jgi:hypothetical protein
MTYIDAKIGRMNGRYLVPSEEGYQPLPSLYEVEEIETEEEAPWPKENPHLVKRADDLDFTAEARVSTKLVEALKWVGEAARRITETLQTAWELCRRISTLCVAELAKLKRVKHLALHHKKERVRKKNRNRLQRELKRRLQRDRTRTTTT